MTLHRLPSGPTLALWSVSIACAASVGFAALPVVARLTERERVWQAVAHGSAPAPAPDRTDLAAVLALAPFGVALAAQPAIVPGQSAAAVDLALQGVVVSPDPAASLAIIAVNGAAPASFHIGDALGDDTTLSAITAAGVALATAGRAWSLGFPDATPMPDGVPDPSAQPAPDMFLKTLIPVAANPDELPDAPAPETVAAARDALIRNPRALLARHGIAEAAPGYRVTDGMSPALRQVGLEPGDLVTALNGEPLTGIAEDVALIDRVAASGSATITLARDGAPLTLTVTLP